MPFGIKVPLLDHWSGWTPLAQYFFIGSICALLFFANWANNEAKNRLEIEPALKELPWL